ncbi:MAG: sulfur carrier protein ThiS [Kordiimonadaceae bacterium]|nr:sulfur carrier protein ThiS [Kordiimonadaceae bacterium]
MVTITVNGDTKSIAADTSVWGFLSGLGLDPKKVAVERNLVIVSKSTFKEVTLADGDELEIVHFIGGG